jgi:hypothetical protein
LGSIPNERNQWKTGRHRALKKPFKNGLRRVRGGNQVRKRSLCMASLTVKVLEADLRCIAPLMPETFAACERSTPDIHLFVSVRVVQVCVV